MSDSPGQLAIIETHTLKFGFPESFITTLQRLLNHKLRQDHNGIHTQLGIINSQCIDISTDYCWPNGCNTLYIINTKDQKKLIKLIVFNLHSKTWFRYIVVQKPKSKKKSEIQTIAYYIDLILNDVIIDENRNINLIHLVQNPKPITTKLSPITVNLNLFQYVCYLAFFVKLFTDFANWPIYLSFIPFIVFGKVLIKANMEIEKRWP